MMPGADVDPAVLWRVLHATPAVSAEKRFAAATDLLTGSSADSRTAVQVFEWLMSVGGLSRKGALPAPGLQVLCSVLHRLPTAYPLGASVPSLLAQHRGAVEAAEAAVEAARKGDDEEMQHLTRQVTLHVQLVSTLLRRSASSFRPALEQCIKLLAEATAVTAKSSAIARLSTSAQYAVLPGGVCSLTSSFLRLTLRAAGHAAHKKAFKALVDEVLPLVSALLGCSVGQGPPFALLLDPVRQAARGLRRALASANAADPEDTWSSVRVSAYCLLGSLFDWVHMDGFEVALRSPVSAAAIVAAAAAARREDDCLPPRKKAKLANKATGESHIGSDAKPTGLQEDEIRDYHLGLCCRADALLSTGTLEERRGCTVMLPMLLEGFMTEYKRFCACRSAEAAESIVGSMGNIEKKSQCSEKRSHHEANLPCEFAFFVHLSEPLRRSLARGIHSEAGDQGTGMYMHCLVALWRLVAEHGAYRPREDQAQLQRKALFAFCSLLLRRLSKYGSTGLSLPGAPEWDGLIHALQLDASPFEQNLFEFWAAIGHHCDIPAQEEDATSAASSDDTPTGCLQFAAALLRTYSRLSDLPACLEALVGALKKTPSRRASCLVQSDYFGQCLEDVTTEISSGKSPSQAVTLWKAMFMELQSCTDGEPNSWLERLLEHILRGLRVSEQSLDSFQGLLLHSLEAVAERGRRSCSESLLFALCMFGRQLRAWDMPSGLRQQASEVDALQQKQTRLAICVARGLGSLAISLVQGTLSSKAQWVACIHGSVQWLALLEQERGCASSAVSEAIENLGDSAQPAAVALAVIHLAARHGDDGASPALAVATAEANAAVCAWLRLFVGYADRLQSSDREDAFAVLAKVVAPEDQSCWWRLEFLGEAAASSSSRAAACRFKQVAEAGTLVANAKSTGDGGIAAAELWAQGSLSETSIQLRGPLVGRIAHLVEEAVTDGVLAKPAKRRRGAAGRSKSKVSRVGVSGALLGLLGCMARLTAFTLAGVQPSTLFSALHAAAMAAASACASLNNSGADACDQVEPGVAVRCLVAALWCLGDLVGTLTRRSSDEGKNALLNAIAVLRGQDALADDVAVLPLVATVFGLGSLDHGHLEALTRALVQLLHTLLKEEVDAAWGGNSIKRLWFVEYLRRLLAEGVKNKIDNGGQGLHISLPSPVTLLRDVSGTQDATGSARCQQRALLLLAALFSAGRVHDVLSVSFDGGGEEHLLQLVLQGGGLGAAAKQRCGFALSILARCVDRCAQAGGTKSRWAPQRVELVRALSALVPLLVTGRVLAETGVADGVAQLRGGVCLLINALSKSWPCGEEDELWTESWLPLVAEWIQLLAAVELASAAEPGSPNPLANFATGRSTAGEDAVGMKAEDSVAECCAALCHKIIRDRGEQILGCLSGRVATSAAAGVSEVGPSCEARLMGALAGLSAALPALKAQTLRVWIVSKVIAATHSAAALCTKRLFSDDGSTHSRGFFVVLAVLAGRVATALYTHIAAPLTREAAGNRRVHKSLKEAEGLLLRVAGLNARVALQLRQHSPADVVATSTVATKQVVLDVRGAGVKHGIPAGGPCGVADALEDSETQFCELLTSAYTLMSALFSNVPLDAPELPAWTMQPHVVVEVFKSLLEAAYAAPHGAAAARIAADVTRLWMHFAQGGTRLVSTSAGRTGQATYPAKVQRATKGFVMMIIAHSLDQQRQWPGVEAATQRSLRRLPFADRAAARTAEVEHWKEVVSLVRAGTSPMLAVLEGSDKLKQSLYAGLGEPLNSMFKELHADYQKHSKYRGEA